MGVQTEVRKGERKNQGKETEILPLILYPAGGSRTLTFLFSSS
jgi:hypothetical protein